MPRSSAGARGTTAWWTVGLGLLALFGAANAAAFVPPERLWYLQLLGIPVPALGTVLVLVAASAVFVRRWWLGGGLLAAVACAAALAPPPVSSPMVPPGPVRAAAPDAPSTVVPSTGGPPAGVRSGHDAEPLRVMTFNANPGALRDQDGLSDVVDREEPHLVALQEFGVRLDRATGIQVGPPFLAPFIKGNRFVVSWPEGGGVVSIRQPILSRLEPVAAAEVVPDDPSGGQQEGLWASGGITRGTYAWQGRPIAVYNVHLHSFGRERPWRDGSRHVLSLAAWTEALRTYRGDFKTRADQARLLRRMLESEELPFIVCGDLNSTPHSWVYAHLAEGLTDAFREAGEGWGGTFPASFPAVRIDVLLVSEEWEVRSARVSEAVASDHLPVTAELVLRPRAGRAP